MGGAGRLLNVNWACATPLAAYAQPGKAHGVKICFKTVIGLHLPVDDVAALVALVEVRGMLVVTERSRFPAGGQAGGWSSRRRARTLRKSAQRETLRRARCRSPGSGSLARSGDRAGRAGGGGTARSSLLTPTQLRRKA